MPSAEEPAETTITVQPTTQTKEAAPRKKSVFAKWKEAQAAKKKAAEEEFKDPAEPVIRFYHHIHIYKVIGWLWIPIAVGSFFSAAAGVIPVMFQFLTGSLLDSLVSAPDVKAAVNQIALYFFFIAIAAGIANLLSHSLINFSGQFLAGKLKAAYFAAVTSQEIGFFDMKKTGKLVSYLSDDIQKIQEAYTTKLSNVFQFLVQVAVGMGLAFDASWKMTLVMLATAPVMAFVLLVAGGIMQTVSQKISTANGSTASTATEVFGSMRTVRSMAGEEKETHRFSKNIRTANLLGIVNGFAQGFGMGMINFIIWAACSLAFWYGGTLVASKEITIGALFKVFGMMLFSVLGLSQLLAQFPDIAKGVASSATLLKVLLRKPQISFKGGEKPSSVEGNISFTDIDFSYPTRPTTQVLKKFSLNIQKGKQVALVGGSGSGKSTILGLVERFYEPSNGIIQLDGIDIRKLDPHWLHRQIAIVTQEPTLFNTTIRKNITYAVGDENVTDEQVIAAAKAANCHSFIDALPDKYNTVVGERGTSLSGGQKQRIAIARAVLQDPKILLLDEATSALDTESEKLVQDALNHLMKGRTSIVIAHRLATVKDADELIVMQFGEIVERGTHYELLKKPKGAYTKLAKKQMMFATKEEDVQGDNSGEEDTIGAPTPSIAEAPQEVPPQEHTEQHADVSISILN